MNFDITNPEIEKQLQALKSLVAAEGAFLHPQLTVQERTGCFSVRSSLGPSARDRLIGMPAACLPAVAAFDLYVCGSDICIRNTAAGTSPAEVRCMEAILAIYNMSGKLADTRKQSPWLGLAPYPELLRMVLDRGSGACLFARKRRLFESNQLDSLLLAAFMDSRVFKLPDKGGMVLMPFIDYINHHFRAPGFKILDEAGSLVLCAVNANPVSGSNEVFVSYHQMMDPLESWLSYNFVDAQSPIAKSVPLVIDIGSGKQLRVKAFTSGRKLAPPQQLKDLKPLLPSVIDHSEHHLTVSRLIIPHDRAPLSLRRILRSLIQTVRPGLEEKALLAEITHAESQVINANSRFYRDLDDAIARMPKQQQAELPVAQVKRIVQLQTAKLAAYQLRIEKMAGNQQQALL